MKQSDMKEMFYPQNQVSTPAFYSFITFWNYSLKKLQSTIINDKCQNHGPVVYVAV